MSNDGEDTVNDGGQEVTDTIEQVGQEGDHRGEVLTNTAVTGLVGEGDEGVNGAVNVIGKTDLVVADETESFNELGRSVQEDETGHVSDNSDEGEGVRDESSHKNLSSTAYIGSSNSGSIGQVGKSGNQVLLKAVASIVQSLTSLTELGILKGVSLGGSIGLEKKENCIDIFDENLPETLRYKFSLYLEGTSEDKGQNNQVFGFHCEYEEIIW